MIKHFILPITLGLVLVSCNRDNDKNNETAETPILPTKIIESDQEREFKYKADKLTEIILKGKDFTERGVVEYKGDLITSISFYDTKTNALSMKSVYTYRDDKLVQATHSEVDFSDNKAFATINTFVYNDNGTITKTSKSNNSNDIRTSIITLTNGNYVMETEDTPFGKRTFTYKYDTKNNPYKNIKGFSALLVDNDDAGKNNVEEMQQSDSYGIHTTKYTYVYNNNDFPIKQILKSGDDTETITFTYNK